MDLTLALLAGLLSSAHCVGMCGAIVLAYSVHIPHANAFTFSGVGAHLSYNGGRVLSYVILGAVAGGIGSGLASLEGIGMWFSLASGVLLILSGVFLLRVFPPSVLEGSSAGILLRFYRFTFGALVALPKIESKFYLGLLTPLLPCGLLYAMVVKAASTGSALQGAATMGMSGLGIVPTLVATGLAGSWLSERVRAIGEKLAAVMVIVMGLALVMRGLGVPMPGLSGHQH